ncbi:hypothetical protein Hypma_011211 [Hypsizygus marmoreus]|uniref:Uncharacterized protein n=1 Tax=Hypsizygus marmoreus TaxID=39966 RepID=A0A369JSC5_HYPMA|nr:hypothetical protein Hypma_011211 [Hypsizygus marmoreus]
MQLHTLVALVALSATPILAYPAPQSFNARASDDRLAFLSTRGAGQSTLGGPQCKDGGLDGVTEDECAGLFKLIKQEQRAIIPTGFQPAGSTQCAVPQSGSKKVGTCFGGGSGWPAMNEVWKVHDYGGLYVLKLANGSIRKIGSKERVGTKQRTHLDGWSGLRSMHG